jgi:signal transduction histidine kinase
LYNGPNRLLVRCNIDEIRRAVTNLIENSLKHAGTRLAIAKSAAEAHGGKLYLLDSLPTGLVARLQLPIRTN